MKKIILVSLINFALIQNVWSATTSSAATVYSPTGPLSGSYIGSINQTCTATNSSNPPYYGRSVATSGRYIFTPDTKNGGGPNTPAAFSAWGAYLVKLPNTGNTNGVSTIPNPSTALGVSPDPTKPGSYLVETAIEWGIFSATEVGFKNNTPKTNLAIEKPDYGTQYFVLTSFTYGNQVNGKSQIGYAFHDFSIGNDVWDVGSSIRIVPNKLSTTAPTNTVSNIVSISNSTPEPINIEGTYYYTNCIDAGIFVQ